MKKILFFAAAALLAAVSCNKEIDTPVVSEGETASFIATVDGVDTKTVLKDKTPEWQEGEKITVHNGTTGFEFTNNGAAGTTATFSYTGTEAFSGEKFLAVSPAGAYTADVAAKTVTGITFPEKQVVAEGTYPADAVFAAAYTEDNTLQFRNAVAIIAFKVADADITYGCLYANNGGDITGTYNLSFSNLEDDKYDYEVPVLTATDAKQWADFHSNGIPMSTDKTYYIAVAPTTFPEGFTVSLNDKTAKSTSKSVTFKRNVIYDLGILEIQAEVLPEQWYVSGKMNNWGLDNPMTLEGDWYVAKNMTLTTSDAFKFRADVDKEWSHNRGYSAGSPIEVDTEYDVESIATGGDITVAANAVYDVCLSKDATKMKIVKVGEYVPPTLETVYLTPLSDWTGDKARFAAYFFGTSGNVWVSMKPTTGESGIYECSMPEGSYEKVIFCRMNPNTENNGWDDTSFWGGQTTDIIIPNDGTNWFTIENDGNAWDKNETGKWSTYPAE